MTYARYLLDEIDQWSEVDPRQQLVPWKPT